MPNNRKRVVHVEHVWGTVVSIDISTHRTTQRKSSLAIKAVVAWLHHVDEEFSTYRPDSLISNLRAGHIGISETTSDVQQVFARCERLRDITRGVFDPWSVPGGFDPSGLVKGWAADRAAEILESKGCHDFLVNAGGDIATRGEAQPGVPWLIGIQHPLQPGEFHSTVAMTNGAIATSGTYERGQHVIGMTDQSAASATVVGPDCATADALATALLIAGEAGLQWFDYLPGWSAQIVIDEEVTSLGPAFVMQ